MECLGFSGSTSMASILEEEVDDVYVIHGSKNALSRERIGINNQLPSEFISSMLQVRAETKMQVVALHCTFLPSKMLPLCREANIDLRMLVRNPREQIMSCFSWAMKKVMVGDNEIVKQIWDLRAEINHFFRANNIKNNIENNVYLWAARRVLAYNADAANSYLPFFKMEDLLTNQKSFCSAFNITKKIEKNIVKSKKLNSHKSFFEQPNMKALDIDFQEQNKILTGIRVHFKSRRINISNLSIQMGYEEPSIKVRNNNFLDLYTEDYHSY